MLLRLSLIYFTFFQLTLTLSRRCWPIRSPCCPWCRPGPPSSSSSRRPRPPQGWCSTCSTPSLSTGWRLSRRHRTALGFACATTLDSILNSHFQIQIWRVASKISQWWIWIWREFHGLFWNPYDFQNSCVLLETTITLMNPSDFETYSRAPCPVKLIFSPSNSRVLIKILPGAQRT